MSKIGMEVRIIACWGMAHSGTSCPARELFVPVQASAQEHLDVGLVADPFIGGQASRPVDVAGGDSQHDFLRRRPLHCLRLRGQSDADALPADAECAFLPGLLEQLQQPILIVFMTFCDGGRCTVSVFVDRVMPTLFPPTRSAPSFPACSNNFSSRS